MVADAAIRPAIICRRAADANPNNPNKMLRVAAEQEAEAARLQMEVGACVMHL